MKAKLAFVWAILGLALIAVAPVPVTSASELGTSSPRFVGPGGGGEPPQPECTDCDMDGFDSDALGGTDCNDGNPDIYPGATEVCDGIDQDCDGDIDDGFDIDADTFTSCGGDCDDGDDTVYPGAPELVADGIDQDCSGGDSCYRDLDNDDYGSGAIVASSDLDCADATEASVTGDCNDSNMGVNPGATEICDGIDQNCDMIVDNGFDEDMDTFTTCEGDCDDDDDTIRPGAMDITGDGIDQNCDNVELCYVDGDGDTYGSATTAASVGDTDCMDAGESAFGTDCDDVDPEVNPGEMELCNLTDDDCDMAMDEGFGTGMACEGVGACGPGTIECLTTTTTVCSTDPGGSLDESAAELCATSIDEDCDGLTDESSGTTRYVSNLGDDTANSCEASVAPCETIQHAIDVACLDETISIEGGTYIENVSLYKRLTLDGAGFGTTIVSPATGGSDAIHVTASGTAMAPLVIRELTVTGATGGANGITIAAPGTNFDLDEVGASINLNAGVAIATGGIVSDVTITASDFSNNGLYGLLVDSSNTLTGLSITAGTVFNGNSYNGIAILGNGTTTNVDDVTIDNVSFSGNGTPAMTGGEGDISLFLFNGDVTITDVTIVADGRIALQLRGRTPFAPAGTVVIDNVAISGSTSFSAVSLLHYSDVSGISFNDVIEDVSSPFGLYLESLASTLELGDTAFDGAHTAQRTIANVSAGAVDATGTSFGGISAATATLAQLFDIEDLVGHSVDAAPVPIGLVRVRDLNVYVTPDSFVSPTTTTPRIQRGVDAATAGDTVNVEAGTYVEQLDIPKTLQLVGEDDLTTTIKAPATLTADAFAAIAAPAEPAEYNIVVVHGAGVEAEITGLTVAGPGPSGCNSLSNGIVVREGAHADIHDNTISDIRDEPFGGCQNGNGIVVGRAVQSTTGTAHITNNVFQHYQKTGIIVSNVGSAATIDDNDVLGEGSQIFIAQNGIQISSGAVATLSDNLVDGHLCDHPTACGPDPITETLSAGVLLVGAGTGTLVATNNVTDNDVGIYSFNLGSVTIDDNTLTGNRYEGILVDEGTSIVEDNSITGGNIGVAVIAFDEITYGVLGDSNATLLRNEITGAGVGVKLLDETPGDNVEPVLTATYNHIAGNTVGMDNTATPLAVADCNWWGAADGPGTVGPGSGDTISTNVDADTWLQLADFGADLDGDTFNSCTGEGDDCNNNDMAVYPGAPEVCDGVINDCDAPGWPSVAGTNEGDDDLDTYTECNGDCNDMATAINPGAVEICDTVDDDCDMSLNNGAAVDSCADISCATESCSMAGTCEYEGTCAVSGTVNYYRDDPVEPSTNPVSDVTILLTSSIDPDDSTVTDEFGDYSFAAAGGDITITPQPLEETEEECDAYITSLDATRIAQHAAMQITLTANQFEAGDVSNNNNVTSFDASLVAQKSVAVPCTGFAFAAATAAGSDWVFKPLSIIHNPITGPVDADFLGILFGDVTGNWETHDGIPPVPPAAGEAAAVSGGAPPVLPTTFSRDDAAVIYVSDVRRIDSNVQVTLGLEAADGIQGLDLSMIFSAAEMTVVGVAKAELAQALTLTTHDVGGRHNVSLFGVTPMAGTGDFLVVTLAIDPALGGLPFRITAEANEGQIPLRIVLGQREPEPEASIGTEPPAGTAGKQHLQAAGN